jgi:hypothetical protein
VCGEYRPKPRFPKAGNIAEEAIAPKADGVIADFSLFVENLPIKA